MDTNPYRDQATSQQPQAVRGPGVKSRILWFALGFGVASAIAATLTYQEKAPRDYTRTWPEEIRSEAPEWIKNAKGRTVGNFVFLVASDAKQASAQIHPREPSRYPMVGIEDFNSDGHVDSLVVTDASRRTFKFIAGSGQLKSYSYTLDGMDIDAIEFFDYDVDGRFDFCFGPGKRYQLNVDNEWRELIPDGAGKAHVDVNGTRVPVEFVDDAWRIVE
jgi:hypothetical protein